MIDTHMLKSGQEFVEINDSYVIFITEKDYYSKGKLVYYIEQNIDDEESFDDGSHIIYVNGSYNDDDNIGHLISDLRNNSITYKRGAKESFACIGNKIVTKPIAINIIARSTSYITGRHFSINTLLSRIRCFWLPRIKFDIRVSFPETRSIREDYKHKKELL